MALILAISVALAADGRVREKGTGDPIADALVRATDGSLSTTTDEKGRFSIDLPAGATVVVLADGYSPGGGAIPESGRWEVYLKEAAAELEVVVESRRDDPVVSEQRLDRERVLQTPGTFEDPVRLVASLPGVTVTPEYSKTAGDIAVRGAAPGENRFYLDGIELPYLYHYNQYASVFHTRLLDELTLLPSTQGSAWGDTTGAVVDTRSAWGIPARIRGSVNLNLVMSGAEIAVPVNKKFSFRLSGRRSYLDLVERNNPWYTSFPIFWDYFGRAEYHPSPDSRWGLTVFGGGDSYTRLAIDPSTLDPYERDAQPSFTWKHFFHIAALQHRQISARGSLEGSLSYTFHRRLGNLAGSSERLDRQVIALREDGILLVKPGISLALGGNITGESLRVEAQSSGPVPGLEEETIFLARDLDADQLLLRRKGGVYGELRAELGNLRLMPGLRLDIDSLTRHAAVDPRLGLRWQALPSTRFRAAAGGYTAFPRTELLTAAYGSPDLRPTHAWQVAAGADQEIASRLEFSLDGYYKWLRGLTDIGPDGRLSQDLEGQALGGEFTARYRLRERFFSAITLAASHATRGGAVYDYDQPFALNVVASWTFLPTWNVGIRYRYALGLPYTPAVDGIYNATTDSYAPVYGALNSQRLPPYQKIDLHIEKRFEARTWNLTLYTELWYVPEPNNTMYVVYSYDYDATESVHGPGFVPLVGARGEF